MSEKRDYNFKKDYTRGLEGEAFLDDFFTRTYPDTQITGVALEQQRQGIDRIFDNSQQIWKVEYKTDYLAGKSGNIFVEMTVNHYPNPKLGWAIGSQADILIYYIPNVVVYSIPFPLFRHELDKWITQLAWRKVINNRGKKNEYSAYGMLLPIWRLEKDISLTKWRFKDAV